MYNFAPHLSFPVNRECGLSQKSKENNEEKHDYMADAA
jgi:hypothetical protein